MTSYTPTLAETAGKLLVEAAEKSVAARQRFLLVLSGGSTPLQMYAWLAEHHAADAFWQHTHIFWGDERFVPYEHEDSTYGAAKTALLDHVSVPPSQLHAWPYIEGRPEKAASDYADTVRAYLDGGFFDLTFLGLGDDAHTASLFPGTGAVFDEGLTTVVSPPGRETRLSMTAHALSNSRTVAFLVQGEHKRDALTRTLEKEALPDFDKTPAKAIRAEDEVLWLTDIEL